MAKIHNGIAAFVAGIRRNEWVGGEGVEVYLRKSTRYLRGVRYDCLDIGSITVAPPMRNKGVGGGLIAHLHSVNPYQVTYVENILTNRFAAYFEREGWFILRDDSNTCAYLLTGR